MNWIFPSVVATLVGTMVLALTFFLLSRTEKKQFLAIWTIGWCLYAIRFGFMLFFIGSENPLAKSIFLILNQIFCLASGVFLLWGTYLYINKKFTRIWWGLAAMVSVYVVYWGMSAPKSFHGSLPVFLFMGAVYFWTGIILVRNVSNVRPLQKLLGILFMVWGLHKIDYPVVRDFETLAPYGYLLGATLALSVSIVMVLSFLQSLVVAREISEKQYRIIVENQNELILKMDGGLRVIYASPGFCSFLNRNLQEILGMGFPSILPPEKRSIVTTEIKKMQTANAVFSFESTAIRMSPVEVWIAWVIKPVADESGRIDFIAVGRDVTEQIRAQMALKKEQYFLRRAQELGHIGTWELDVTKNELSWTEENYRIFAVQPGTPLTIESFYECVHPDDLAFVKSKWVEAMTTGNYEITHRLIRNGETRWVKEKAEIEFDDAGNCVSAIGFTLDITDAKRAQEEQDKLNDQLQRVQKMESVGALAGGIAHDFNNMLGVILGNTEMAMDALPKDHPLMSRMHDVLDAAERSASLTRKLLGFARKQTIAPRVLDLNDTVEKMLKVIRHLAGEEINVFWKPEQRLDKVKLDPSQIDQIMTNLCVNARDAIGGTGAITIETRNMRLDKGMHERTGWITAGDYVVLTVTDTGVGMNDDTLDQVFEPFFTTKKRGKGTGLGLSTVYGIVMQNNGNISVKSSPGAGTTFSIFFPKVVEAETADTHGTAKEVIPDGDERILLVEDDEMMRDIVNKMLMSFGYDVTSVGKPKDAISLFQSSQDAFELLITDVVMPQMTGKQLAAQLTSLQPHLAQLYISGYPADVIDDRGVLEEGTHFLSKPFTKTLLAKKVREILDTH